MSIKQKDKVIKVNELFNNSVIVEDIRDKGRNFNINRYQSQGSDHTEDFEKTHFMAARSSMHLNQSQKSINLETTS